MFQALRTCSPDERGESMNWGSILSKVIGSGLGGLAGALTGSVGTLGGISFYVASCKSCLTFDNLKMSAKARTSMHEVIGKKPLLEFIGPDAQELSLTIQLREWMGVNPLRSYEALRGYVESGEAIRFVVGGKPVGKTKWVIESVSGSANAYNGGQITSMDVDLTLKEYVESGTSGGLLSSLGGA